MMKENDLIIRDKKRGQIMMYIALMVAFLFVMLPFFLVLINAFKLKGDIIRNPLNLIGSKGFTFKNFTEAIERMSFWKAMGNSTVITLSATIITIVFSAMSAFVIARNDWKVCRILFVAMISSMVVPFQVVMVPLISIYGGTLNMLNNRITLILMHVGFHVSLDTFLFCGAIKSSVPRELEEAAEIDGCSPWRTFWTIVFPLLKPTTLTVFIINSMTHWNDFLLPSLVLSKKHLYTLPIAMRAFNGQFTTDIGLVMASLLLMMIPILTLYLLLQKYIVEGITAGAVKS